MSSKRADGPLIGITTRLDLKAQTFYLRRYYAEAIAATGGVPVYIPLISDRSSLTSLAARLDGIVLSGSASDVDPCLYGEEPHPKIGPVVSERDETDLAMLEYAETHRVPLLAICFGAQSLNVSRGGTLYQDIPSQVPDAIQHEQAPPVDRPYHTIDIAPDSLMARLAGGASARVNSTHHQSIKTLGKDLKVTAKARDGVIEAVEDTRGDRFVVGVQWHPESGWRDNELSKALFSAFVEATKER